MEHENTHTLDTGRVAELSTLDSVAAMVSRCHVNASPGAVFAAVAAAIINVEHATARDIAYLFSAAFTAHRNTGREYRRVVSAAFRAAGVAV